VYVSAAHIPVIYKPVALLHRGDFLLDLGYTVDGLAFEGTDLAVVYVSYHTPTPSGPVPGGRRMPARQRVKVVEG
jgi:hypothetical protein